jgi:hypothetical protein
VDSHKGLGDFDYSSRVVDEDALRSARDEEPFTRESFELLKELAQSVSIVACVLRVDASGQPREVMTRDEAILAGLMIRLSKLQHGLLQNCNPERMELLNFFARGIVETAVNLRYLLEFGTQELFDAFVAHSLSIEAGVRERVEADIAEQDGEPLPIQQRILDGQDRAFELSGVTRELAAEYERGWSGKGGIWGRFDALGLRGLYPLFQIGSQYLHGNWHDVWTYHLRKVEGGWVVDPDFGAIRPQALIAAVKLLADVSLRYLEAVSPASPDRDALADRIAFCGEKSEIIEGLHEAFLARSSDAGGV